jgi:hypothetical protein
MSLLTLPANLYANPQWYDYLHRIELTADGAVNMWDGGGQVLTAEVHGQFTISEINETQAEIAFTGLAEYNPYREDEKLGDLPDAKVTFTKETGTFIFRQELVWGPPDPEAYPYLLYRTRYVFDSDPLAVVADNQWGTLYHMTEQKDFVESVRFYYLRDDEQKLTFKELKGLGYSGENQ